VDIFLREDAFRQTVFIAGKDKLRCRINREVALSVTERKQTLHGRQGAHTRDRSQTQIAQMLGEALQIREPYPCERLLRVFQK
jgi:hypothetical protein